MSVEPKDFDWWWGCWKDLFRCGNCWAYVGSSSLCPVCAHDYRNPEPREITIDGKLRTIPQAFAGALSWSHYVMLQLMHREWLRPLPEETNPSLPADHKPSSRVLIVLLFWTFFETMMTGFYETATGGLPKSVGADLLKRYNSIGSRLDRLHIVLFGTTYAKDLDQLGFTAVRKHLENVQDKRNAFMHGNPEAISDSLVAETVRMIPAFQEAWTQSFNLRCAKR
jgi:hypothetical protein